MVVNKATHAELMKQLNDRANKLYEVLESRELRNASEGCKRGSWAYPATKVKLKGTALDVRLAVDDFKNILAELKKLK